MRRPPGRSRRAAARPPARALARLAEELRDDGVHDDITTRALLPGPRPGSAVILAESAGVLSGGTAAVHLARSVGLGARLLVRDGAVLRRGQAVLRLSGDVRRILGVERTVLNTLMHLSGVATATAAAVRAVDGKVAIYATRKTLPGLKDLEKAAVVHGGGFPHRRDLSDGFLLKSRHLDLVTLPEAVRRLRASGALRRPLQVEVRSVRTALDAVRAGAEALLVDNLPPAGAARIVQALTDAGLRDDVWIELSGGITPATAHRYVRCGADALSLGGITHSAPSLPFHLRLVASHGLRPA
jgi:nicotinate-nucleotide pyrophosphorylase (carboxylating)